MAVDDHQIAKLRQACVGYARKRHLGGLLRQRERGKLRGQAGASERGKAGGLLQCPARLGKGSGGLIDMVTEEEIVSAYQHLARAEGIFVEPASAASVAGLIKLIQSGFFKQPKNALPTGRKTRIVCVCTGHGLKDPDNARKFSSVPISVSASVDAVMEHVCLASSR